MHKQSDYLLFAVLLGFALAACNPGTSALPPAETNPGPGVAAQRFEGYYASGPDMSSFVTCGMAELPAPGKGYWLIPNEEFSRLLENPTGISMSDLAGTYGPYDVFATYVRFEGILSAEPGKGYGHSGLYTGEIRVTRALEASRQWVGSTYPQKVFRGCIVK